MEICENTFFALPCKVNFVSNSYKCNVTGGRQIPIMYKRGLMLAHQGFCILSKYRNIPYRMKIYTEFTLATWVSILSFTELNISKF